MITPSKNTITKDVAVGSSPAGVEWVAYAGRHTQADIETMIGRLRTLWAEHRRKAESKDLLGRLRAYIGSPGARVTAGAEKVIKRAVFAERKPGDPWITLTGPRGGTSIVRMNGLSDAYARRVGYSVSVVLG